MDTFLIQYHNNIDRILKRPSGQHGVDPEKLEEWIQAQQSETRRDVARRLAEQIVYVSFDETKQLCKQLVQDVYKDIPEDAKVVWWVGSPDKSGYLISILCYHYLLELDLPEPDLIVSNLSSFESNAIYLKWDDMTYSGSQLDQLNTRIVYDYIENRSIEFPDIRHCLVAATENALSRLQKVFISYTIFYKYPHIRNIPDINVKSARNPQYSSAYIPCPFQVYAARTFKPLDELLGLETYYLADFFFNFNTAKCIVYFDHKIADSVSTYMHVLLYGIVPPLHIDSGHENAFVYDYLEPKYGKFKIPKDKGLDEHGVDEIQFKPFLKGCKPPVELFEQWKSMPYTTFMQVYEHLYKNERNGRPDWNDPLIRCPFSWYKLAFRGGNRTRRNRKSRKNKKTRAR